MKKILISTFTTCLLAGSMMAQTSTTKSVATAPVNTPVQVEKTAADMLYDELLPSTAQVMFIDSVVVPKANFLARIPITSENGILKFEGTDACYYNEFKTTKIYATQIQVDSIEERHIFTTYRDQDEWSAPQLRQELENNLSETDFPFLLADGTTFYFAGKGETSMGGYDIFKTSYDSEEGRFLEPHNMGMPFSSKANDYLLAINDIENIGWLVTDRNQPEDSVCIYTFEPSKHRVNISSEASSEVLESFADIRSISDTWQFGDREAALRRIASVNQRTSAVTEEVIEFVVNDNITYTSISQFKSTKGADTYKTIEKEKAELKKQRALLEQQRDVVNLVKENDRATVIKNIEIVENNINLLEASILSREKKLRQAEQ